MAKKNIEDVYTLSPLQEGLLFHSLYSPEADAYLQHLKFSVRGPLDVRGFEGAWQRLVARHAILRTSFVWDKQEKPLQVVRREVSLPWQEVDLRGLSAEEQERRLASLVEEDRRRGLDLSKAPLLRMTVARTADEAYECFCAFHHLLTDGWSTSLLIKELFQLYN
ncbi:MAG TPA: condensation domain-containing protein, partial [Pyrinomonadaceae bacterium]|nr:condensation domain-containing protein [Pyrinomonadaceae bacterium]